MADEWINRTEIKSESDPSKVYTVAQHAEKRHWACSCPAWQFRRRCKHLQQLGLPAGEQPFEMSALRVKCTSELVNPQLGVREEWRQSFLRSIGLKQAQEEGITKAGTWEGVLHGEFGLPVSPVSGGAGKLLEDYEKAGKVFLGRGQPDETSRRLKVARFRLEAYLAWLEDQREKIQAGMERITQEFLVTIEKG